MHIYVVKVKKGAEPFSKVHFLGDFEVRCSQMDVLPTVTAPIMDAACIQKLFFGRWPRLVIKSGFNSKNIF